MKNYLLSIFDPVLEPIRRFIAAVVLKMRNWWRKHREHYQSKVQPVVMTEDEYDGKTGETPLLIITL